VQDAERSSVGAGAGTLLALGLALGACGVDARTPEVVDRSAAGAGSNSGGVVLPGVVKAPGLPAAGMGSGSTEAGRGAAIPVMPNAGGTNGAAANGGAAPSAGSGGQAGSAQTTDESGETPPADTTPLPAANLATLLWSVGGEGIGPGLFNDARSVGVDASGVIYVAEFTSDAPTRVQRFAADGSFLGQWFTADEPIVNQMVVDRNGKLYLLQSGPIYLYDGASGSKLGTLELPTYAESPQALALTPDNGLLSVASNQILRFDAAGQLVLNVEDTVEPALDNSFFLDGATMDGLGNMYFISTFETSVYKFNAQGAFQDRIGTAGTGVGQFDTAPESVAVDGRGRIYADDFDGIEVFEPDGDSRGIIPASGSVFGMVVSDQNDLIVLDRNTAQLLKYQLAP